MKPFKYTAANTLNIAMQRMGANGNARFLAGGTNLLDLMKEHVEQPDELVDINRLKISGIKLISSGERKGGIFPLQRLSTVYVQRHQEQFEPARWLLHQARERLQQKQVQKHSSLDPGL